MQYCTYGVMHRVTTAAPRAHQELIQACPHPWLLLVHIIPHAHRQHATTSCAIAPTPRTPKLQSPSHHHPPTTPQSSATWISRLAMMAEALPLCTTTAAATGDTDPGPGTGACVSTSTISCRK
jgi:hypothetical protein